MLAHFDGLIWLGITLVALLFLQRTLHGELLNIIYLLTRREDFTSVIFALIFFPGVALHETSHYLMAKLLRVRTGRFSLIPELRTDGRLRLGFVETGSADIVRDSLIGAAPLIAGGLFVSYAATRHLYLLPLWEFFQAGNFNLFWMGIGILPTLPDFWLWFYLTFAVSSTMLPSESDRHAWLPLGGTLGVLLVIAILFGAGEWMLANLALPFNNFLRSIATVFGLSAGVHMVLVLPLALIRRLMMKAMRI